MAADDSIRSNGRCLTAQASAAGPPRSTSARAAGPGSGGSCAPMACLLIRAAGAWPVPALRTAPGLRLRSVRRPRIAPAAPARRAAASSGRCPPADLGCGGVTARTGAPVRRFVRRGDAAALPPVGAAGLGRGARRGDQRGRQLPGYRGRQRRSRCPARPGEMRGWRGQPGMAAVRRPVRVELVSPVAGLCAADPGDRSAAGTALVLGPCVATDAGTRWRIS